MKSERVIRNGQKLTCGSFPLMGANADVPVQLCRISEKVSLHVLTFTPRQKVSVIPLVFVGGLATIPESLRDILEELSQDHVVHYVETREKSGSLITGKVSFTVEAMAEDLAAILDMLGMKDRGFTLAGYSLGATILAEAYGKLSLRPKSMVLMEPTPVFHYPGWSLFLIRYFGVPFYNVLLPLSKFYLKNFLINVREDADMAVISFRALDHADPRKLRTAILAIADYEVWEKLPGIDCPVLIVGTSRDHLHVEAEINRMVSMIPDCRYIDMETNQRSHSAEMGKVIRDFSASLC